MTPLLIEHTQTSKSARNLKTMIILRNSSITLARHRIGVLRDATTTINDGDNELINRERNSKRKDNSLKPRSTQLQGKRKKLVTILAVRDVVTTKENARM